MFTLILTCAGNSTRAGENKILYNMNGKTVLENSLIPFLSFDKIERIIVTANQNDLKEITDILSAYDQKPISVILGGKTRFQSVKTALSYVTTEHVIIHDGARPYITREIIENNIETAKKYGSAVTCVPSKDTVSVCDGEVLFETLGKENISIIQTPQSFDVEKLKTAFDKAEKDYPDESSVYLDFVEKPHISIGSYANMKITYKQDLLPKYKTGNGFDCHKLVENRKLIIGGTEIPHSKGLLGHSDADVLLHAVTDSLLSALSLPDIGCRFPDTDEKYKDANSTLLLKDVVKELNASPYKVESLAVTVMAEKPKMNPYRESIIDNLSNCLNLSKERIGLTFTTLEGLGFVGREEGICANANIIITLK